MKVPLSWLKEYIALPFSAEKIAETLTLAGIEVESIEQLVNDTLFDISLTPNLGHCQSVIGIARQLSALLNIPFHRKRISFNEAQEFSSNQAVQIEIASKECSHYSCRYVKNIQVGPSPKWLQERLNMCGFRSINNLVDISNYVMMELGQPLHFFDYRMIEGKKIRIIPAPSAFEFLTLDDQVRQIPEGTLMIADEKNAIAIAGVMGGKHSAISDTTKEILIESGYFSSEAIRKSIKSLGLRTEGAARWEKGVDPLISTAALDRAIELLAQISSPQIAKGVAEQIKTPYSPRFIECSISRINRLLGTQLSIREIAQLFIRLEMKIENEQNDLLRLQIPSYRHDLKTDIDLVEEIAILYGYNHIPRGIPRHASSPVSHAPLYLFEEEVRTKFTAQGLQEFLTCGLISPTLAKLSAENALNASDQIPVLHPRSVDQSVLRSSLLPGFLQVVRFNLDRGNRDIAAFEVGKIHFKHRDDFIEHSSAALILSGKAAPYHWDPKPREQDFFDLKGHIENLLLSIGVDALIVERSHLHSFHPGRQAVLKIGDLIFGVMGEVHPNHLDGLEINQRVFYAELNLSDLIQLKKREWKMQSIGLFPGSTLDWNLSLKEETPIGYVFNVIERVRPLILANFSLFDLYKSEKIGKDRKNITLRFAYRSAEKTLSFEEVESAHLKLIAQIEEHLKDYILR